MIGCVGRAVAGVGPATARAIEFVELALQAVGELQACLPDAQMPLESCVDVWVERWAQMLEQDAAVCDVPGGMSELEQLAQLEQQIIGAVRDRTGEPLDIDPDVCDRMRAPWDACVAADSED